MEKISIVVSTTSGLGKREGMSTVMMDYLCRFDRDLFDITVIAGRNSDPTILAQLQEAKIAVAELPPRKKNPIGYVLGMIKLLRKKKTDIFYIHGCSAIMAIDLSLAALCGCKVRAVHCHSTDCDHRTADKLLRPLFYRVYTDAFACGRDAGRWLFGSRPFRVLTNGRDVETYRFRPEKRIEMRRELGLGSDTLAMGHVGNFTRGKNQEFLLPVFKEILKRRPDSRLYLMGKGARQERVMELCREAGLEQNVVFTGSISNVPDMLQAMDVMAMPSLFEGLPLVAAEWQIAGLPCVLSDQVTEESAFSDLAAFLPLSAPAEEWAEKLLTMAAENDRETMGVQMVEQTRKSGFDINENALELQKIFADKFGRG